MSSGADAHFENYIFSLKYSSCLGFIRGWIFLICFNRHLSYLMGGFGWWYWLVRKFYRAAIARFRCLILLLWIDSGIVLVTISAYASKGTSAHAPSAIVSAGRISNSLASYACNTADPEVSVFSGSVRIGEWVRRVRRMRRVSLRYALPGYCWLWLTMLGVLKLCNF